MKREKSFNLPNKKQLRKELEEGEEAIHRPSIYPHAPRHRSDYIENLVSKKDFDLIKSPQLEGAINLGVIILALVALKYAYIGLSDGYRLLMETEVKYCITYGILFIVVYDVIGGLFTLVTFFLYKLFLKGSLRRRELLLLHYLYLVLFTVNSLVAQWKLTPVFAITCATILTGYVMKAHSFVATNILLHEGVRAKFEDVVKKDKRRGNSDRAKGDPECVYPDNVSLGNYCYFMYCAPSLVYETRFVRSRKVRVSYVVKEGLAFVGCCFAILSILSQFILPIALSSKGDSFTEVLTNVFTLCVPSTFVWIIVFYGYFHCWLNLKSELCCYGNRDFYKDWWNSDSITSFWRKWNLLFREWCLRHVFVDSIYYFNVSKDIATTVVAIVSMLMNELYLSIGFKVTQPYFLIVMLTHIPLAFLSKKSKNSRRVGNILMWISVLVGQPLVEIMYFRNWISATYKDDRSFWCN